MRKMFPFLCLAGIGVIGCEVGPNYTPPQVNVQPTFSETNNPTTQTSRTTSRTIPITQWWATFRDPQLDSLIQRAVQQNLDLKQAQSRVRQARFARGIIASGLFPDLNATGGYQHARGSKNIALPLGSGAGSSSGGSGGSSSASGFRTLENSPGQSLNSHPPGGPQSPLGLGGLPGKETDVYQAGFDSTWELDIFGGTRRAVEAANANIQAAAEDQHAVLVTLLGEVARTYIDLRGLQFQASIARSNLKTQQDTLAILEERSRAGLSTDLDVTQQQTQVETTAATIPALDAQISQNIHALGILLALEPDSLASELKADAPLPALPDEVPVGFPSELLRRRPDIRRAERQLAAATAMSGVAEADLFPRFSLTGQAGVDSSAVKNLFQWDSRYFLISPGVTWPIFDAGKIRSNIAVQNEITQQAAITYQQTVLQALKEVEDAIANYRQEQARRASLQNATAYSKDAVNLANEQYKQGVADFLRVLDAERSMLATEDQLAQSDRAVASDLVALYKALGGGWEVAGVEQ